MISYIIKVTDQIWVSSGQNISAGVLAHNWFGILKNISNLIFVSVYCFILKQMPNGLGTVSSS